MLFELEVLSGSFILFLMIFCAFVTIMGVMYPLAMVLL